MRLEFAALTAAARVLRLLLRKGAALAALGIGLGLVLGAGASRAIAGFLFGVSAIHASTYTPSPPRRSPLWRSERRLVAARARKLDPALAMRET